MGEKSAGVIMHTADFIKVRSPSGSEDVYYSTFCEGIPEEFRLEAQNTLNETEENKQKGMKTLKAFAKREDLRCTDDDLLLVLRACKYYLKRAEKKLKSYLKLRQKVLNLVSNMDESKTRAILDDMSFGVLPYRNKCGRIILVFRPNFHLDQYHLNDIDPLFLALLLYIHTLPLTTVTGVDYIFESKTINFLIYYPILKKFKKSYMSFCNDFPSRIGRIDIMNTHCLVRWGFSVLRPLIPEKISKKVNFYGNDYDILKAHYDPEILPEEFGGNLGPLSDKHFRQGLLDFIQKLKEEHKTIEKNKQ